jgi:hypothetical protein
LPYTPFATQDPKDIQLFVFTDTLFFAVEKKKKRSFGELYPLIFYVEDNRETNDVSGEMGKNKTYPMVISFRVPPGYSSVVSPPTSVLQSYFHIAVEKEKTDFSLVMMLFTFDDVTCVMELRRFLFFVYLLLFMSLRLLLVCVLDLCMRCVVL